MECSVGLSITEFCIDSGFDEWVNEALVLLLNLLLKSKLYYFNFLLTDICLNVIQITH